MATTPPSPHEAFGRAGSQRLADAMALDLAAKDATAVGLPSPEMVTFTHPHLTADARGAVGAVFFRFAALTGTVEAFRTVAFELALAQEDRETLALLGVIGRVNEGTEYQPQWREVRLRRSGDSAAQLRGAVWTWGDGAPIARLADPDLAARWFAQLALARVTPPAPADPAGIIPPRLGGDA